MNINDLASRIKDLINPLPVLVVDILDFPSLIDLELLDKLRLRQHAMIVIVNKYDLMPDHVQVKVAYCYVAPP